MEDKKTSNASALEKKKDLRHQFFAPSAKSTPPKINHVNGKKTGEVSELTKAPQLGDASALQAVPHSLSPQRGKRVREKIDITG